ncbi:response regulator transcription factor [Rhabdobacter roseus]|uniref:DNA-binding response OmpR family regulator n=1 Tax=Rhabdobacter roseus TaxID=1655419 RepID=A0A840U149_9BACT|nr:response regulator transcription factor [Rhabdobacter roseus]MBB5287622.1 DNA-binding response OmpR family regulator [Rhabdobacter roseus]
MKAKILYVEDDPNLGFTTKDNLEAHDYEIVHCPDGKKAWAAFQEQHFDLCVLDVMLPEMDGFTLARHIREVDAQVPVLFLTARSMQEDKIQGLLLGGDDYLTKPFSIQELVLRIEVFLRRTKPDYQPENPQSTFVIGKYRFDFEKLTLSQNGQVHTLTFREAEVLKYLASKPRQVVKREEVLTEIWGDNDYYMGRSLDVFVSRLRKYLSQDPAIRIDNVHGVGFRLSW